MPRYWIIAPFKAEPGDRFDKVWQFDLANSIITIGWTDVGDVSKMSREDLLQALGAAYPEKSSRSRAICANMIWAFYHEIDKDDLVIARRGRKSLVRVGKVSEKAQYSPGKNPVSGHPNFLKVAWQAEPRDREFPVVVFPMNTVAEIPEEQFRTFLSSGTVVNMPLADSESVEPIDSSTFVLEKYLEEFIVSNFQTIFQGDLRIYEDTEGNDGQQYSTEIGPIDILAVESKSNSFVVIELKKGRPSDQVVGQILRYMGWVKKNLCNEGQSVKGLVVCRDPDPKLSYALQMTRDIDVRYYNVSFKLMESPATLVA